MTDTKPDSIFDMEPDEAHEASLDAKALADHAAGRVVPHDEVSKWLESWGTLNELPCPEPKPR